MNDSSPLINDSKKQTLFLRFSQKLVQFQPQEGRSLLWAAAYSFLVLFSYYLIRPLRESLGSQKGLTEVMTPLMTSVLIVMVIANPIYGYLVSHFSRRKFIPWIYHFFSINLLFFFFILIFFREGSYSHTMSARIFFVWVTVFNLFVVSILWDFMTDIFNIEQGKRLFGFIFAGGSVGGILGPFIAEICTKILSPFYLLLCSALALQAAIFCVRKLTGMHQTSLSAKVKTIAEKPPGKSTFSGVIALFSSPYLLAICGFILFYTLSGTLFYLKQNQLASTLFKSTAKAIPYFSRADLFTNLLSFLLQAFLAGRFMIRFGVKKTLALLPIITILGFLFLWWSPQPKNFVLAQWLGWTPQLLWLMLFQIFLRSIEFSLIKPARKVLFTVLSRDEKYSAQSITDTFVPRLGDAMASGVKTLVTQSNHGIDTIQIGVYTIPIWISWIFLSFYLGKEYTQRASALSEDSKSQSS